MFLWDFKRAGSFWRDIVGLVVGEDFLFVFVICIRVCRHLVVVGLFCVCCFG